MHKLSLLTHPLQFSLVPSAVRTALRILVAEGEKYFGSNRALRIYAIDPDPFLVPRHFKWPVDEDDIAPDSI